MKSKVIIKYENDCRPQECSDNDGPRLDQAPPPTAEVTPQDIISTKKTFYVLMIQAILILL